ncbi:unnamed protein product [Spirodela intermedia]|uniref:Uncharacterized protein n=1 Tax=Spirodela intermedia TaxID=51605 RepID=A0A7I8I8J3_SPIIN|nr:unnamed protein product [Spirodela intermedia]CAA6653804.1 unnamed protein product [Spirodela intermedia]
MSMNLKICLLCISSNCLSKLSVLSIFNFIDDIPSLSLWCLVKS